MRLGKGMKRKVKKMNKSHWADIKCTHLDTEDLFWRVDAWTSLNSTEEGKVIAYIDDLTGRVIYNDPLARTDRYAQEVILGKLADLDISLKIEKQQSHIAIFIPTAHGSLVADIEPDQLTDTGYDAVFIGLQASEKPDVYVDIVGVRSHKKKDILDILIRPDPMNEDCIADIIEIEGQEIKALVELYSDAKKR